VASVRRLTAGDELDGELATGRPGDWLVENGEIAFVVEQPGRGHAVAKRGGQLVDIADGTRRRDEVSEVVLSIAGRPVHIEALEAGVDAEG
jgi:hypothetical protein